MCKHFAKSHLPSKNIATSSQSSPSFVSTLFPRATVCRRRVLWLLPISSHKFSNIRDCKSFDLMKFTILREVFKTFLKLSDKYFDINAALWRLQWVYDSLGLRSSILVTTPLFLPHITCAPSVHIPVHLYQSRTFVINSTKNFLAGTSTDRFKQ